MRSRVLAPALIACVLGVALPASSQADPDSRGSSRPSGGGHGWSGGHAWGGGRTGTGRPGGATQGGAGRTGGGERGRDPHRGGGHYGWHGSPGWGGAILTFPLWWDAYSWWGLPYPYLGYYGYYPYFAGDGPDYLGGYTVPESPETGETGPAATGAEGAGGTAPASGTSAVELHISPASAVVLLNGVPIGSADEFDGGSDLLYLDAGEYVLEFRAPGFRTRTLKLAVAGGNPTLVSLDLAVDPEVPSSQPAAPSPGLPHGRKFGPSFGPTTAAEAPSSGAPGAGAPAAGVAPSATALVLRVSPPDAAVYLDGAFVGTAEDVTGLQEGLAVSPGPHRIDVVAPGHAGKTLQFDAQAGRAVALSLALD